MAGLILLDQTHTTAINPGKKPVVGWRESSQGVGALHNPMGFAMTRIVHLNDAGEPMYDQIQLIENAGAIVLPVMDDRIGLIHVWRPTAERLMDAGAEYIRRLEEEARWDELTATLGQWHLEAPRGLAPSSVKGENLENYILRTAKLEAAEEAGFTIVNARIRGRANMNTTFFAHAQYVVSADVVEIGDKKPEDLEVIGATRFFTLSELRKLTKTGEFVCGSTLAAMALCGLSLPE